MLKKTELLLKELERRKGKMNRVLNSKAHLENLLKEGDKYYIGFGTKNLTTEGIGYRDLSELIKGNLDNIVVMGRKGPLKENIDGKLVRKQPESKTTKEVHIDYVNRFGTRVEYDRTFDVWEKIILHKYRLSLKRTRSPQGETILFFPQIEYKNDEAHFQLAKAAINIAIYLGGYFQIYNNIFEPIMPITDTLGRKILEKGTGNVFDKLEHIKASIESNKSEQGNIGNSYRFAVLKEYNITDVYNGIGGFNEYFQFELADDNILIFENLRSGNATFIFRLSEFNPKSTLDKQNVKNEKGFLERVIHTNLESWQLKLQKYLKKK